jgi:hypothetical protein
MWLAVLIPDSDLTGARSAIDHPAVPLQAPWIDTDVVVRQGNRI